MSVSCVRTTFTEFTEPVKNLYAEQKLKAMESLNKGFPVKKKITYTTVNNLYAFLTACKSSFIWFYGIEKSNAVSDLAMILDSAMESPLYWIITLSGTYLIPVSDKKGIKFVRENEYICAVFHIAMEYSGYEKLFTIERDS